MLFASLQTLLGKQASEIKELLLEYTDLAIVDEIHNFINKEEIVFSTSWENGPRIMGMTATPFQGVVGNVKFVDEIAGDIGRFIQRPCPNVTLIMSLHL